MCEARYRGAKSPHLHLSSVNVRACAREAAREGVFPLFSRTDRTSIYIVIAFFVWFSIHCYLYFFGVHVAFFLFFSWSSEIMN